MDPLEILDVTGVARTRELLAAGMTARKLAAAVTAGTVVRVHQGVYCRPEIPRSALVALRLGGKLAQLSAAESHGLWILREPGRRFHVWVPPQASRLPRHTGTVLHWDRGWSGDEDLRVSVLHALWQIAVTESAESFLVALESAMNKGLVTAAEVEVLAERLPRRLSAVLDFAGPLAQSGLETLVRWRLHRLGIEARPQVQIPGVGRVDLLIGRSLIIETDGESTHEFHNDRRRDASAAIGGKVTLRFSYRQILDEWESVEAAVRNCLDRGLHLLDG